MTDNSYPLFTVGSRCKIVLDRMLYGKSGLIHSFFLLGLISLLMQCISNINSEGTLVLLIVAVIFLPYIIHAALLFKTKLGYAVFHDNSAEIIAGSQTHNLIYGSEIELKLTAHVIIGGTVIYYTAEIIYNQNGVNKKISLITDLPDYFTSLSRLFRIKSNGADNLPKTAVKTVRSEDKRVIISPPFKALTKGSRTLSVFFNVIAVILFALIGSVFVSLYVKGSKSLNNAKDVLVFVIVTLIILAAAFLIRLPAVIYYRRKKSKTAREIVIADDFTLSGISVNGKVFPRESINKISVIRAASSGRLYLEIQADGIQKKWLLGKENNGNSNLFNDLYVLCGDINSAGVVKSLLGIDVEQIQI